MKSEQVAGFVSESMAGFIGIRNLRHEALSRMAANRADLKTLMRQSGHKTVAVLMQYLNPTKEEQRARLFGVTTPLPAAEGPAQPD